MAEEIKALTSVIEKLVTEQERKRISDEKANKKTEADMAELEKSIEDQTKAAEDDASMVALATAEVSKAVNKGSVRSRESIAADKDVQKSKEYLAEMKASEEISSKKLEETRLELENIRHDQENAIKLEEETKEVTKKMLRQTDEELQQSRGAMEHIAQQKVSLEALETSIKEQGGVAADNKEFNKRSLQIEQQELDLRKKNADTPAARKQIAQDQKALNEKQSGLLKNISKGMTGLWEKSKEKIKGAGKGIMTILKGVAIGGMLLAVIAFLNSPYWEKTKKIIVEDVLPVLEDFWEFLKDHWGKILVGIVAVKAVLLTIGMVKLFQSISAAYKVLKAATMKNILDPLKGTAESPGLFSKMWTSIKTGFTALKTSMMTNIVTPIKDAVTNAATKAWQFMLDIPTKLKALAVATKANVLVPVQNAVTGAAGKVWAFMTKIPPALMALKVFFASTFLPAVTAFMVPLLPIIAIVAAISLALYALWSAFEDAEKIFEETGSIGEALKVGISKFMGTILGFIPAMILKLVGWVAGLFGFDDFKSKVDAIDPIQWISDTIKGLFDKVQVWFTQLFTDPVGAIVSLVGGYLSIFTDFGGWVYRKALKPAIDWFGNLFGVTNASESLEAWVGDKIKIFKDFGGWVYEKAIKPAIDWFNELFPDPVGAIKTLIGEYLTMFKDFGGWIYRKALKPAIDWFGNLFGVTGVSESLEAWVADKIKIFKDFGGWVYDKAIKPAIDWLGGLFTWGDSAGVTAAGDFSLVQMIGDAITNIWEWFKNLFDIDVMSIAKKIPGVGKLISWFSSDSDKPISAESLAEADAKAKAEKEAEEAEKAAEEKRKAEKKAAREKAKNDRELERRKVRSDKRQTVIAEKKEELKQSQLFIKTGGKEGKDTVTNVWGSDVEAEKEAIAAKEANIAKLIAANEKATEADAKFKAAAGVVPDMKTRVGRRHLTADWLKLPFKEVRAAYLAGKVSKYTYDQAKDKRRKGWAKAQHDDAVMRRDRELAAETSLDAFDVMGPSRYEARDLQRRKDQDRAMQQESFGGLGNIGIPTQVAADIALDSPTSAQNKQRVREMMDVKLNKTTERPRETGLLVNAPTAVNTSKKVNIALGSKSIGHPNAVVERVNIAR